MAAVRAAKKDLRKVLKKALSEISNESVTLQTSNITKSLIALPEYERAQKVSIYLSMPAGEVQTAAIVQDALNNGKRVFIPYCYKRSVVAPGQTPSIMDMLELTSWKDYESLEPDSWGIPTPSEDSVSQRRNCFGAFGKSEELNAAAREEDELDLIVTPGLGFDNSLGRIGRGMGFYDSFFERCGEFSKTGKRPWRVGLALNEQVLPADQTVPMDGTDQRIDVLILGNGSVLRPSGGV